MMVREILHRRAVAAVLLAVLLAGCSTADTSGSTADAPVPPAKSQPTTPHTVAPTNRVAPAPAATRKPRPADPRWVFFSNDRHDYGSAWFSGRHRIMIGFGCTDAPYYSPDASCSDGNGFHHGIDVAMPCGTPLRAGRPATVLADDALGSAYGDNPVLLRVDGLDVVIGHTRKVFVSVGDRIVQGERFALAADAGAPDGCHLHFEVRQPGTGVSGAIDPAGLLGLE